MKKHILTIAIILGLSMTSFADGGLFQRGNNGQKGKNSGFIFFDSQNRTEEDTPMLPPHASGEDESAAPLGTGIALLTALGAGYVVAKKRREE